MTNTIKSNKNLKKLFSSFSLQVFTVILILTLSVTNLFAQNNNNNISVLNSNWLLMCANNLKWNDFKQPNCFSITVIGSLSEEYTILTVSTENQTIADLPVKIFRKKVKDLIPTDIIYVNEKYIAELEEVAKYAKENKCLVFTSGATNLKNTFVNIQPLNSNKIEYNPQNINIDVEITKEFQDLSGTKESVREQYDKVSAELDAKQKQLNETEKKLKEQLTNLEIQTKKNEDIKKRNDLIESRLNQTMQNAERSRMQAGYAAENIRRSEYEITKTRKETEISVRETETRQKSIDSAKIALEKLDLKLIENENEIKRQIEEIKVEDNTIVTQERNRKLLVVFFIVVVILLILIIKSLRDSKKTNFALSNKNAELKQQTKEINKQNEQLSEVHQELEKLSIVAGRTQNAIIIMDRNGYFEWVNAGFTRVYGYTLQLLRNERDENIVNVCSNKSIRNILFKCVSNKQTIIFESDSTTRSGKVISSQTTLTPILDKNNEVSQLVAIYTDISKLKEQELAIRNQNEELLQQKNTLESQKNQIEEQNRHIKSGIYYAQTIQQTILPEKQLMDKYFDNFVLYKPKDIVSGDFYWFSEVEENGKNIQFIGDFDCTGHGVPGAFMSLIGNRLLNEIVNVKKLYSPRDIMENLNISVIKALKQEQSSNNDGMDTCLCKIEKQQNNEYLVTFCGAKRPLYYLQTQDEEVKTLKGDRKSIGGVRSKRNVVEFTNQQIVLKSGDIMYLSSDGIIDQNDKDRKRFGTEKFLDLLLSLKNVPIELQSEKIEKSLNDYKKDEEQRDDISVIGIKFR